MESFYKYFKSAGDTGKRRTAPIFKNPDSGDVEDILSQDDDRHVRFLVDETFTVYMWPAMFAVHNDVMYQLKKDPHDIVCADDITMNEDSHKLYMNGARLTKELADVLRNIYYNLFNTKTASVHDLDGHKIKTL